MSNSNKLKQIYFDWLFEEYHYTNLKENVIEISIPFLDSENDKYIMYVEFLNKNKIRLTDDGWTINKLRNYGINFTGRNKTNNRILQDITSGLGVETGNGELFISTDLEKFPVAKQRLLQAIMQVNDMNVLQKSNVKNIFFEEVEDILKKNEILFSRKPSFPGKEGITIQFDFSIPTNKNMERLIRTIPNGNDLNRSKLLTIDTQLLKGYKNHVEFITIIDDVNNKFNKKNEMEAIFNENTKDDIKIITLSDLPSKIDMVSNKIA